MYLSIKQINAIERLVEEAKAGSVSDETIRDAEALVEYVLERKKVETKRITDIVDKKRKTDPEFRKKYEKPSKNPRKPKPDPMPRSIGVSGITAGNGKTVNREVWIVNGKTVVKWYGNWREVEEADGGYRLTDRPGM